MKTIAIACLGVAALRLAFVTTNKSEWTSAEYEEIAVKVDSAKVKMARVEMKATLVPSPEPLKSASSLLP